MTTPTAKSTTAYTVQAMLSFAVALAVVIVGECYLPVPGWTRAFLALGTVFLVSSSFTLAKCIRDQQESENVVSRIDQARIERLLAEFDPYRSPEFGDVRGAADPRRAPGPPAMPTPPPYVAAN